MRRIAMGLVAVLIVVGVAGGIASAHITPPVVLVSDREALVGLLAGAQRFFVREARLSPEQRRAVEQRTRWRPDEDFYRFFVGRGPSGDLVVATVFLTDFTIHGPVRVAVAVGPDGAVRGARVVEVTEETYVWIKPLIDANFMQRLAGAPASPGARDAAPGGDPMSEFYAGVIAGLVQRAAALFDVAVRQAGGA